MEEELPNELTINSTKQKLHCTLNLEPSNFLVEPDATNPLQFHLHINLELSIFQLKPMEQILSNFLTTSTSLVKSSPSFASPDKFQCQFFRSIKLPVKLPPNNWSCTHHQNPHQTLNEPTTLVTSHNLCFRLLDRHEKTCHSLTEWHSVQ